MLREMETPDRSEPVNLTSGDHVFVLDIQAIYCPAAGVVRARLRHDAFDTDWTVQAGQYLLGHFRHVKQAGTSPTIGLIGVLDGST